MTLPDFHVSRLSRPLSQDGDREICASSDIERCVGLRIDAAAAVDASAWDSYVSNHPQGSIHQTTKWAEITRRYYGARSYFLTATRDGQVVGQLALAKMGRFPDRDARRPWRDLLKRPVNLLLPVFRWDGGPLVNGPDADDVQAALLGGVDRLARSERIAMLAHGGFPATARPIGPIPTRFDRSEWGTFRIDLTQSSDTCWKRLKGGSARTAVRRAVKMGVTAVDATAELDALVRCELAHSAAHGLAAWPALYWSTLRETLGTGGYRVLGAEYGGKLVAFVPVVVFGSAMHLQKPMQDPSCKDKHMPAGDLLIWEAIQLGRRLGLSTFDLAGVSPAPGNDAEKGIYFFKSKWGGDYVSYPVVRRRYRRWVM